MIMAPQKLILVLPLLLLISRFLQHCHGCTDVLEKTFPTASYAKVSDRSSHVQPTDFPVVMSRAGRFGYGPRRSALGSSNDLVNVKDFGAKGDGSSDDTKVNALAVSLEL